jgi:hypothetical protein
MKTVSLIARLILASSGFLVQLQADQPIMNMMPRWNGGYGIQTLLENSEKQDLKLGDSVYAKGLSEQIQTLHVQGVYTWTRAVRMTFKLPYTITARRESLNDKNEKIVEKDQGWGDLTLALPLKRYFNLATRTGNWSITPQIKVPLGQDTKRYQVADRLWASGLSLGYETETYQYFFATSLGGWIYESDKAAHLNASLDIGINALDYLQVLWENDLKYGEFGRLSYATGPAIYWRWQDHVHSRIEWKHELISKVSQRNAEHGNSDRISIGIGFVF